MISSAGTGEGTDDLGDEEDYAALPTGTGPGCEKSPASLPAVMTANVIELPRPAPTVGR